jgi:hypothetical protein
VTKVQNKQLSQMKATNGIKSSPALSKVKEIVATISVSI